MYFSVHFVEVGLYRFLPLTGTVLVICIFQKITYVKQFIKLYFNRVLQNSFMIFNFLFLFFPVSFPTLFVHLHSSFYLCNSLSVLFQIPFLNTIKAICIPNYLPPLVFFLKFPKAKEIGDTCTWNLLYNGKLRLKPRINPIIAYFLKFSSRYNTGKYFK